MANHPNRSKRETPETHDGLAYVTRWIDYPHYGQSAYRIWARKIVGVWMQRHEWRAGNGTVRADEWIRTTTPSADWIGRATVVPISEPSN